MAFRSSQQSRIYIGILAASAYARTASSESTLDTHDVTTLADSAEVSIPKAAASMFSIAGPLDDSGAANGQFDAITDLLANPSAPTPITYMPLGTDGHVWLVDAYETAFTSSSAVDGGVDWSMAAKVTGPPDMAGVVLENNTTVTADTDGTANTGPAGGTSNGGVAHLHVTAYSGFTSDDIIIEQSTNGSFAGEETTLVTFTQVTGLTSERIEVSGTVDRYLRVADDVTGTGSITRHVSFSRR
jgi:hypothetical protein